MEERGISVEEVTDALVYPHAEYPGRFGRTVAEHTPAGRMLATKVVYNRGAVVGAEDEIIVVTVERGRPTTTTPEGGEA